MSNNHNAVAHAWAHQTGKARKGFNMFYDGPRLYSYGRHWELARLVTLPSGNPAAMFYEPSRSRSVSTNKHYGIAARAVSHMPQFAVQSFEDHGVNYDWYIAEATSYVGKAKRARVRGAFYLDAAKRALGAANDYAMAWQLDRAPVTLENLAGYSAELNARVEARRQADEQARASRNLKATRKHRKATRETLRAWLAGDPVEAPYTSRPFCRVKDDAVETSYGATVPLSQAVALFRRAAQVRKGGIAWEPAAPVSVGDFTLNKIGKTGNLVVGCHNIPFRFAKLAADRAGISL